MLLKERDLRQATIVLQQVLQFINKATINSRTFYPPSNTPGSQDGEDEILRQLLPLDESWTYVDVGASHPRECSNTWQFYEAGKRGLLIDPRAESLGPLAISRPGDYIFPVAAGDYRGVTIFRVAGACSSIDPHWMIEPDAERIVDVWPLRDILALFPQVRDTCKLCSIDVEGAEAAVLRGIDWSTFCPDVLVLEYVDYHPHKQGRDRSGSLLPMLEDQGYREYWRGKFNLILVQKTHYNTISKIEPSALPPKTQTGTFPFQWLDKLQSQFGLKYCVETGTARGTTTALLAAHFDKVWTIELGEEQHKHASKRLAEVSHITNIQGHSALALKDIMPKLDQPTLFFLDAHWSGGDTAKGETECPLLEELAAIGSLFGQHVILIDDARLFNAPPPPPHDASQWPTRTQIETAIEAWLYYITEHDDIIFLTPEPFK